MKKEYILFIDSGIGGLSTLAETYKITHANFIYYSDNKNHPYGSHTKDEIFDFVKSAIDETKKNYHFKIVVLACNTATTSSIEKLREVYTDLCFVGTEPAIKQALDIGYRKIFVLATPATSKQNKYKSLLKLSQNSYVKTESIENLASSIENYLLTPTKESLFSLEQHLHYVQQSSNEYDCIVLGCTHYCLIENEINKLTHKPLVSGNIGVAKRVFAMQKQFYNEEFVSTNKNHVVFVFSASTNSLKQKYIKIFSQILANN